ncbi:ADP-ribosylation factor-like protein 8d [Galendromus occidentalis]|uniref:ADP-ribosylation factor-like protein 8d n=1 Tax=Galendromus occidentalis TaxID=34638 RepID=A0AAJ7PAP5_9ACAR|nr:ADP-ribosylation factor-like protein 8d [Galendromus occidentalis]
MTILTIGPVNSGKSSLIKRLEEVSAPEYRRMPHTFATTGLNISDLRLSTSASRKGTMVTVRELGGVMYNLWTKHAVDKDIDAIIFVIDGSNREFFPTAHVGLYDILTCGSTAPLLIVFNKADLCSDNDIERYRQALGVDRLKEFAHQEISVVKTSVKTIFGVDKMNAWISDRVTEAEKRREVLHAQNTAS